MANRTLQTTLRKIYTSGDVDTIYLRSRPKDIIVDDNRTLEDVVTKVDGVQTGATTVATSASNGYITINGTASLVYSHPNSGVTAGTYNRVTVNATGHVTSASNVTDWSGTVSGDSTNATSTFTQASSRANLASGEKLSVSFGKIMKWFADLKSLAFVDKVGTANLDTTLTTFYNTRVTTANVTTSTSITASGWVADARAIATLQNAINSINSNLGIELISFTPYLYGDTTAGSFTYTTQQGVAYKIGKTYTMTISIAISYVSVVPLGGTHIGGFPRVYSHISTLSLQAKYLSGGVEHSIRKIDSCDVYSEQGYSDIRVRSDSSLLYIGTFVNKTTVSYGEVALEAGTQSNLIHIRFGGSCILS